MTQDMAHGEERGEDRIAQKSYWIEHSAEPTVEAMMLDSKAADIDKMERPEVLKLLGSIEGLRIVELGAGIGRFTGELARTAGSVYALDFMQNLIDQNRALHGHLPNTRFSCGDVTELELDPGSTDLLFSNWLMMYLSDGEVARLAANSLRWVAEGGCVFFRESCFRQSGDKQRKNNPTHYRNPREYFKIYDEAQVIEADGRIAHFELVCCKCIDTYVRVKQNQNQVCWKWRKVVSAAPESNDYRHFLDGRQYSSSSLARYERVFGAGFLSAGGLETTKEFAGALGLAPEHSVLDVGCGIGGSAFHMARTYGCYVYGIDLSVNAVLTALESAAATGNGDRVSFEISDCTKRDFADESFDVVYSRDTILHIADKAALFQRLFKVLKPGGQLLVTDYCCTADRPSPEFDAYIRDRGYKLLPIQEYAGALEAAGFVGVAAEDRTAQFEGCLRRELAGMEADREGFVAEFSERDYAEVADGWRAKLARVEAGEQRWALFRATKPAAA